MSSKKEIETKIRIDDFEAFNQLKEKMEAEYTKIEKVYQHDVYYSPEYPNYMDEKYPYKWLRLRYLDDGRAEICFKHFFPEGAEKHTFCNEYQLIVAEPEAMSNILAELGLRVIADVEKYRTTYCRGRYFISFDSVNNLGNYIEIEVKDVIYDEIRERELLDIELKNLGLSIYPVDLRGYPFLIYYKSKGKNYE